MKIEYIIIIIGISAYIPLFLAILKDNGASQNFLTWLLFFILDDTQIAVTIAAQKDWYMICVYAVLGGVTTILLGITYKIPLSKIYLDAKESFLKFYKSIKRLEKVNVTHSEVIVISVIICLVLWLSISAEIGLIFGVIAQMVAGIPLIEDTYKNPRISAIPSNILFFTANLLFVIYAKDRSWINLIFCFSFVLYGSVLLFPLLRELRRQLNNKLFGD